MADQIWMDEINNICEQFRTNAISHSTAVKLLDKLIPNKYQIIELLDAIEDEKSNANPS